MSGLLVNRKGNHKRAPNVEAMSGKRTRVSKTMSDRISRDELTEIIRATEAAGRDASELRAALASMPQPGQSRKTGVRPGEEEESTTAERLQANVGDLFPDGITEDVLAQLIKMDGQYSLKDLRVMCQEAGLGTGGDKKTLAAKLLASGNLKPEQEEVKMQQQEYVDLNKPREWEGEPETVAIPEAYIKDLKYEIIVFARKERGGSDFSFRCKYYDCVTGREYKFAGVLIDTSKKNPQGEVTEARLTYHPEVRLVNVGFMIIQAPES